MELRQRIRKIASTVLLVVFLSSNLLDPFYYAFAEENLFVVKNEIEVMEDETEVNDDEMEEEIVVDEVNTDVSNEEDVDEVVVEEPVNHEITGDDDPE
jgi:hypothetical protein